MSKQTGCRKRALRPCVRLTMPSMPRYLAMIRAAVGCLAGQEGFSDETIDQCVLATDEALSNVIKHGYACSPDGGIEVILRPICRAGRTGLVILILDRGRDTNPTRIGGRDLCDLRPGGLGVHIIRSVMDKVQYRRRGGGGMLLRMVKFKDSASARPDSSGSSRLASGTN